MKTVKTIEAIKEFIQVNLATPISKSNEIITIKPILEDNRKDLKIVRDKATGRITFEGNLEYKFMGLAIGDKQILMANKSEQPEVTGMSVEDFRDIFQEYLASPYSQSDVCPEIEPIMGDNRDELKIVRDPTGRIVFSGNFEYRITGLKVGGQEISLL